MMIPAELMYNARMTYESSKGKPLTMAQREVDLDTWRKDTDFTVDLDDAKYTMSIVNRQCRNALKDGLYRLQDGHPKRTNFRYTAEETESIERLLRTAAYPDYPQTSEDLPRFQEMLAEGLIKPDVSACRQMQDIALLRNHLGALCEVLGEHGQATCTPRELRLPSHRRKIKELTELGSPAIGHIARQMLATSDLIDTKTQHLVNGINRQHGQPILAKEQVVDISNSLSR